MHMAQPLTHHELERARAWLRSLRGDTSQLDLAADITKVTGWTITRDRYSRYESGSIPMGRGTLERFVSYWTSRGQSGPDLTPPQPPVVLDPYEVIAAHTEALNQQTAAMNRLVAAIAAATGLALEDSLEGSAPDQPNDDAPGSSRHRRPA
jgi:hypothetical protein